MIFIFRSDGNWVGIEAYVSLDSPIGLDQSFSASED